MPELVHVGRDGELAAREAFARCVTRGGVALFPADTVYGLACDPLDEAALERVHRLKGRDPGKPSAVMYFSPGMVRELLFGVGPRAQEAVGRLLPGPVTLVLPNPSRRYPLACGPSGDRIGARLVGGPLAGAGCVVLQTSANPSGGADPRTVEHVDATIREGVDLVVDAGELPGTASTVIDLSRVDDGAGWRVLREGAMPTAEVEAALSGL